MALEDLACRLLMLEPALMQRVVLAFAVLTLALALGLGLALTPEVGGSFVLVLLVRRTVAI